MEIGSLYKTNKCGYVKILSIKNSKALVEFLDTGTQKEFRTHWIKNGNIRDPYAKTLCGVACTGNISTKGNNSVYYSIWHDMINRCYNKNNKRYNAYKNVSVAEDWLIFENFYNDCKFLKDYNDEKVRLGILTIDKDISQMFKNEKLYSKDTCVWLDKRNNSSIQNSQQRMFFAVDEYGNKYTDYNISRFAKEHNLNRKNISSILHGRGKTTHGWQFSYEEIV